MRDKFKPIGNYAKIRRGASPRPIGDPFYFGGDVGWVRISDVTSSSKYLRKTEQYLSSLGVSKSVRVDKGDLVMSICGTIGKPIIIDMPACIHDGFVQLYDIKGLDTEFFYYQLQYSEKALERKGQPGTQVNLNTSIVGDYEIYIPQYTQQLKVAKILSTCDQIIARTEIAIAKYQAIKQGMMHDLFTRGIDLTTGKLRPKYENSPELYEESKLGWIPKEWSTESIINSTYLKGRIGWQGLRADEFIEEGPYLVTGTDFNEGKINWSNCYHVTESRYREAKYIQLKEDDFLITKDGTIGKTAYVTNCPEKAVLNSGIFLMRCKNDSYVNKYVFYLLNSSVFDRYLYKSLGGSTIVHLYQREFEKFIFPLPKKNEQQKIINKIDLISNKILIEQSTLAKYQQIKAGLMQDLLSGKVEVKVDVEENIEA